MIDHTGINCSDYRRSQEFYDMVLGVLGFSRQMDFGRAIGYGRDGKPAFWISEAVGMGPNREIHLAFEAADEDAVRAPRLWPEYHPGYFGAFVRDPDGNNIEAVCHGS
jgi:catechol 2,3-dioxygenase-like lactoylglutathione lyase family enzyme